MNTMLLSAVAMLLAQAPATEEKAWEPLARQREYNWMSTASWMKRHENYVEQAKKGNIDYVFLGDSITEGWGGTATWKQRFAPLKAAQFGISGDTTQNVLWRIQNGTLAELQPQAVVVLIGTNNFGLHNDKPESVIKGVSAIVKELQTKLPKSKILLMAIFPRDELPDTDFRKRILQTNEALAKLADGKQLHYLDLGPEMLDKDGKLPKELMPDFLHLSEAGYKVWSAAVAGFLAGLR